MYYADRVVLTHLNPNGTYTATSHLGDNQYSDCIFITENPDNVSYEHIGKHALLMSIDNQNFILGYYIDEYEVREDKVYVEGEKLMRYGDGKAVVLGDAGYIGIYDIVREQDGSISKTPKLEYNADDKVYASFTEYMMTLSDASATTSLKKDSYGFNIHRASMKGRNNDYGNRYEYEMSGSQRGMKMRYSLDVTPGMTRSIPMSPVAAMPKSMSVNMGYDVPLDIMFALAGIPNTRIKIDDAGKIAITTGAGVGPSIELNPGETNSVVIKANAAGTASITMNNTGKIDISAITGIEITGAGQGLMAALIAYMQDYLKHTHPSAMGPTGPPVPPSGIQTLAKLNMIKGS